jgi:hypothetical protein
MQTYTASKQLAAAHTLVWRWISDVERWPEWCPTIDALTLIDRPMKVGARARILQPEIRPATWTVDVWDPPRRFAWSARHPGVRVTGDHVITQGEMGVTVTLTLRFAGVLAWLMRGALERQSRAYLAAELEALERALASEPV